MKKSRKNMLRSSAAMLLVSALALTTATYAWFTRGNTGSVTDFEFSAKSEAGLQLSTNGTTWKETLTSEDIHLKTSGDDTGTNTLVEWSPLSSGGTLDTDGKLQLFSATIKDGKITAAKATGEIENISNCVSFKLYVKNNSAKDQTFNLNFAEGNKSAVTKGTGTETVTSSDTGIQNAVRVAFVYQGSVDGTVNDASSSENQMRDTDNKAKSAWIWEPNAAAHTNTSNTTKQVTYGFKAALSDGAETSNNLYVPATGQESSDTYVAKQDTKTETDIKDSKLNINTIPANSTGVYYVYVWIEGQDIDCTNNESNTSVKVSLHFIGDTTASE